MLCKCDLQRMTTHHSSRSCGVAIVVGLVCLLGWCSREALCVNVDHVVPGFNATPLMWVENNGLFLYSINQSFALGFWNIDYGGGNVAYYLCVQHVSSEANVWCANRNNPVRRSDIFSFNSDGSVALRAASSGAVVWTITSEGSALQMQESGNLVLFDAKNKTLWQSFDHPTDTLITGQRFSLKMRLVAGKSLADISEGSYYMSMDDSNLGLALYSDVSSSLSPQVFWTMESDGKTTQLNPAAVPAFAEIDSDNLVLLESDGVTLVSEILLDSFVGSTVRRAVLGPDGNLHVYFLSGSLWNPAFAAVRDVCSLPESCGPYGLCSSEGQCNCPGTLVPNNSSDFSKGCSMSYDTSACSANHSTSPHVELLAIGNVDYYANQYTEPQGVADLSACKQLCMANCSCTALFFHNESRSCYVWGEMGTIMADSNGAHLAFLKVLQNSEAPFQGKASKGGGMATYVVSLIAVGTTFIILGLIISAWRLYKKRLKEQTIAEDEDELIVTIPGLPTRFSYKELELATNGFRDKLGSGGFGSVYEGVLGEKIRIAVKRLEGVGQGKKEFWAEVATIGSIHHVHLVQLRGFCVEGSHRLLVYEFMANGSLAKVLFSTSKDEVVLDWATRCKICVGTARGLAYLHDDCRERILHCDIKPENILLDEHLLAKVADFGLAKLMNPEQSEVFTTLRGTRGYLAPEWLLSSAISDRSDVYSFGMVMLEVISGRKNFNPTDFSEKGYFPIYAFCQEEIGAVSDLVDPKLEGAVDVEQVSKLIRIALWCIQDEVAIRPSMKKVVKMLEGIVDVPNPPQSPQLAVRLHGRKFDYSANASGLFDMDRSSTSEEASRMSASRLSAPR